MANFRNTGFVTMQELFQHEPIIFDCYLGLLKGTRIHLPSRTIDPCQCPDVPSPLPLKWRKKGKPPEDGEDGPE